MFERALVFSVETAWAHEMRHYLLEEAGQTGQVELETDPFRAMSLGVKAYDLIVVDLLIPGFDASQLLLMLKNNAPKATFIALGEGRHELERFQAIQNGANAFFNRPVSADDFAEVAGQIYQVLNPGPAEPAVAVRTVHRASGQEVRLIDLASMECLSGNSTLLHVTGAAGSGDLFVFQGDIFHAQCPGATGEAALAEMLGWSPAELEVSLHQLSSLPPRTIEGDWQSLLKAPPDGEPIDRNRATEPVTLPDIATEETRESMENEAPANDYSQLPEVPALETDASQPGELPGSDSPYLTQTGSLVKPEERYEAPSLISYWSTDLMGQIMEGENVGDLDNAASTTFGLYRQLADLAVALETDYFTRCTVYGHTYTCDILADNLALRQAVFETASMQEEHRDEFVAWCYGRSL
ncbi:MAG: response regulator [Verrucomicrobiota bacterium]